MSYLPGRPANGRSSERPVRGRGSAMSPAAGYTMPAEWERHEATWLAFPHNASDWPGKLSAVRWAHGEFIRKVTEGENVNLLVNDAGGQRAADRLLRKIGVLHDRIRFRAFPTDRAWMRDSGPIFVRRVFGRRPELAIVRFRFSGWAKYPDHSKDDRVALLAARALGLEMVEARTHEGRPSSRLVLEGGSIDVNGEGSILTTEECLLDTVTQVRNPGLDQGSWERLFATYLGAGHTIWLGKGIVGDDTHGHVDDIARFVTPRTIVACREGRPVDANYAPLEENWERLAGARLRDGTRPEVVPLPMPAPVALDGHRLPASYANFYMCNAAVLVPTFNDENDRRALGILAELIRDRPVIGIHAVDLLLGLGTLHCLSQQQPAP